MIDFDEEFIEFKFMGSVHKLSKPNNGQIKSYTNELKTCESDEDKELALLKFLDCLGMSKELFYKLNPVQTQKLLSSLYESEKN